MPYRESETRHDHWRNAAIGAAFAIGLALLFWATAAGEALPAAAPDIVRDFTPANGMARLVWGLFISALVGALAALAAAAGWRRIGRLRGEIA